MPRQLRVFLCHASQDKPAVWRLYRYLKQHGVQPWLDQADLLPGQNWKMEIPKTIDTSDVILVCLSKNSVNKEGFVQTEITFALDKALEKPEGAIFIIPIRFEECDVPKRLRLYQWVDYFHPDGRRRLLLGLYVRAESLNEDISPVILEGTRKTKPASILVAKDTEKSAESVPWKKKERKAIENTESEEGKYMIAQEGIEYLTFKGISATELEDDPAPKDFIKKIRPPFFSSWNELLVWTALPLILLIPTMIVIPLITRDYNFVSIDKIIYQILIAVLYVGIVALYVRFSYHNIMENEQLVVFRGGKGIVKKGPGHVFTLPFIDKPKKVDLQEKSCEIKKEPCVTRDFMLVNAGLYITWQINDPILSLTKISKVEDSMLLLSAAILRTAIAEFKMQETQEGRQALNALIRTRIEHIAINWGIQINSIELRELHVAEDVMKQIENRFN